MPAETYHTVAKVGEVPEGEGRAFEVDGRMIAVFLSKGEYFALEDSCPHQGAPLSDGANLRPHRDLHLARVAVRPG